MLVKQHVDITNGGTDARDETEANCAGIDVVLTNK